MIPNSPIGKISIYKQVIFVTVCGICPFVDKKLISKLPKKPYQNCTKIKGCSNHLSNALEVPFNTSNVRLATTSACLAMVPALKL